MTGGVGTGVDVGVNPLKGVTDKIVNMLVQTGNATFGTSEGTIYDQMGFGSEGHVGVIGGISFDPFAEGDEPVVTGAEVGNIGGGVYGTGSFVIPIWDPDWRREPSPDPQRIRNLPAYGWRP